MPIITNRDCERAVSKRVKLYDDKCSGLLATISPSGVCAFSFKFWDKALAKQVSIQIGRYHRTEFPVEKARAKAYAMRANAEQGVDLAKQQRGALAARRATGVTFEKVVAEYLAFIQEPVKKRDGGIRPRKENWKTDIGRLKRPLAEWSDWIASEITDDDVAVLLEKYSKLAPVGANRCRSVLGTMFKWARQPPRKYVTTNPCSTLGPKNQEHKRRRVLDENEIRKLWLGLDHPDLPAGRPVALALKMILVSMLRPGEVTQITRKRVVDGQLIVPMHLVKSRREDIAQPMNGLAHEIIAEALADETQFLAFPGQDRTEPMQRHSLSAALGGKRNKKGKILRLGIIEFLGMKHFTPHDLRRTAATLAGKAGIDEAKIDRALDHVRKDVSGESVVYNLSKYENERREVVDAVEQQLRRILGTLPPGQVVPFKKRA